MAEQLAAENDLSKQELDNTLLYINDMMALMQQELDNGNLKLGRVDDTALIESLSQMINEIATSAEQAEAILASMGYDAEVEESTEEIERVGHNWVPTEGYQASQINVGLNGQDTFS